MSLPPEFTSLYRLFLRATSATVLHNGPATRGLRRLYRPTFEAAASVIRHTETLESSSNEADKLRKWMARFDERINNTLSFFHVSAQSRGLSHKVVSRLSFLSRTNYPWTLDQHGSRPRIWQPRLDPDSPEYTTTPPTLFSHKSQVKAAKRAEEDAFNGMMWGALGEVVRMAEGRDGLVMSKVRFRRQVIRKKKFY